MTQSQNGIEAASGPDGSIFLSKTDNPMRRFEQLDFELLTGRGIGYDKEPGEIDELYRQLQEARNRHLGDLAAKG